MEIRRAAAETLDHERIEAGGEGVKEAAGRGAAEGGLVHLTRARQPGLRAARPPRCPASALPGDDARAGQADEEENLRKLLPARNGYDT